MGNPIKPLKPIKVIDSNGVNNMTGTSTVVSGIIDTWGLSALSLEIQAAGTAQGALTLAGSNQYDPATNPNAAFVPLPSSAMVPALPSVNGSAVSYLGSVATGARYVQLKYVNATGAGQLNVWMNGTGA